jgi:hypothetical protein
MFYISDDQAELVSGGFNITVSPTIAVSTAVTTALQGNNGVAIGLGIGGIGAAGLFQGNGLGLSSYLGSLPSLPV